MGYGGSLEYVQALRDIVVVLMIEKRGAVENLEEILEIRAGTGLKMVIVP
jgi:2-keto-3-deoxy-L-rhamnonate aldolase RhmA